MARVKSSVTHKKRYRKVVKQAKGYFGKRKNVYTVAKHSVTKALTYAYDHRRKKKSDFRKLWIIRIGAGLKSHNISYSQFIHVLEKSGILLNRKALAHLAVHDEKGFTEVVKVAKLELSKK